MFDKEIGIIGEGITDQIVLQAILIGFTENKSLDVRFLQPKENESGNWDKVFKYCESDEFKESFAFLDYVVIQIDSDFMLKEQVGEKYKINIQGIDTEQVVILFKDKIIQLIGNDFFEEYKSQIIFAISVHELECWLLPIYYTNDSKKVAKIENCIDTLNKELTKKEGFFIDAKDPRMYEKMAKHFRKKKDLEKFAAQNPSFLIFYEELKSKLEDIE